MNIDVTQGSHQCWDWSLSYSRSWT
uniref:Uncharacterized protein n=1 Tax=mine drainage metagenome TaxID=410659 RepID=E6QA95_9ZZZZ